jgi:hypothetical protein
MIPASKLVQLYIRLEKVKERLVEATESLTDAKICDERPKSMEEYEIWCRAKSVEYWEIIDEMAVAIDLSLEEGS